MKVSLKAPPMTFSIVEPDDSVSVKPTFTACAADFDRSITTLRVVVPEKSRVSVPPLASMIVSLPSARSVSNR